MRYVKQSSWTHFIVLIYSNDLEQLMISLSLKSIIVNAPKYIMFKIRIKNHFSAKMTEEQSLSIITLPGRTMEYRNRFVSYFFMTTWQGHRTAAIRVLFWFTAGNCIKCIWAWCCVKSSIPKHTCKWAKWFKFMINVKYWYILKGT